MGSSSPCVGVVGAVVVRSGVHEDVRILPLGNVVLVSRGRRGWFARLCEDGADWCPRVDPDGRRGSGDGLQRALRTAFSYAVRGSQKPGEFATIDI